MEPPYGWNVRISYYIHDLWVDEINFLPFYMCHELGIPNPGPFSKSGFWVRTMSNPGFGFGFSNSVQQNMEAGYRVPNKLTFQFHLQRIDSICDETKWNCRSQKKFNKTHFNDILNILSIRCVGSLIGVRYGTKLQIGLRTVKSQNSLLTTLTEEVRSWTG